MSNTEANTTVTKEQTEYRNLAVVVQIERKMLAAVSNKTVTAAVFKIGPGKSDELQSWSQSVAADDVEDATDELLRTAKGWIDNYKLENKEERKIAKSTLKHILSDG